MSKDFFTRVKNARKTRGLTIKEVSKQTGISVGHISEYENGKTNLEGSKLISLCRFLGVSFESEIPSEGEAEMSLEDKENLGLIKKLNPRKRRELKAELYRLLAEQEKEALKGE